MCHSFKTLMCDMTKVGSHSKHCSIHRSSSKSFIWKTFLLWFIVMKTRDKNMLTMVLTAKTLINIYHNMLGGNRMITKFVWVWMQTTAVEAVLTETDMQNVHSRQPALRRRWSAMFSRPHDCSGCTYPIAGQHISAYTTSLLTHRWPPITRPTPCCHDQ